MSARAFAIVVKGLLALTVAGVLTGMTFAALDAAGYTPSPIATGLMAAAFTGALTAWIVVGGPRGSRN